MSPCHTPCAHLPASRPRFQRYLFVHLRDPGRVFQSVKLLLLFLTEAAPPKSTRFSGFSGSENSEVFLSTVLPSTLARTHTYVRMYVVAARQGQAVVASLEDGEQAVVVHADASLETAFP